MTPAVVPLPITAWSIVSALGVGGDPTAAALREGRSGLGPSPIALPFPTVCGAVAAELRPLTGELALHDSRQARIALIVLEGIAGAIGRAVRRHGADRVAFVLGTSTGGIDRTERALAHHRGAGRLPDGYDMRRHTFDAFAALLRRLTGATGPAYVVSTACSSSAKVFASAARLMAADLADAVVVGGIDALCLTTLYGFRSLDILAAGHCRPFGVERPGINIGEGGALLLLERGGDGPVRLLGVGESSDAHKMTSPHPDGLGARLAMSRALEQAGASAEQVDHINAHGTGTAQNDASEARAIAGLFGDRVPVASTKGYTGHTLGAAGAIEAVFACLSIEGGFVPTSLGAAPAAPDLGIQLARATLTRPVARVLSNSFGFGGSNASVLLGAA